MADHEPRCIWCGRPYHEHEDKREAWKPVPRVPCLLLKSGFRKRPDGASNEDVE